MNESECLKKNIVDILNVDPGELMDDTTFLGDLGADSLDIYQIIMGVEEDLGISLETEDIESIITFKEALDLIEKTVKDKRDKE